MILKEKPMQT